jgi:uncharacterized protein YegL
MEGKKLDALNNILPELTDALAKNPILSDKIRFSLIDFSDDARVVLPLCDLAEEDSLPGLSARGGTSYAAAFALLRQQLEADASQLLADGHKVHRPAVFFISDGEPTDDESELAAAWNALTSYNRQTKLGNKWYPNFIPFGVDGATRDVLARLVFPPGKSKLYLQAGGGDPAAAIRSMAEVLISSVLASGQSAVEGSSGIILPGKGDVPDDIDVYDEDWPGQ